MKPPIFLGHVRNFGSPSTAASGYCTTAQALADYAAILAHLNRGAERSAVVVFGGSYGGATGIDFLWFSDAREVSGSFFQKLRVFSDVSFSNGFSGISRFRVKFSEKTRGERNLRDI